MILLKRELDNCDHGTEMMGRSTELFAGKKALLLDMNGTFMFGEDRFSASEDFSEYYSSIGGTLPRSKINSIIRSMYEYLNVRYTDETYRHHFPSVTQALAATSGEMFDRDEIPRIIDTFAHHERGTIPAEYAKALKRLGQRFTLGAVIDIWSPKATWLAVFRQSGIGGLFQSVSFSSDHGVVKPSPKPFQQVLSQLHVANTDAIVIGDSPRRDLGGARAAGIDCILVGGAQGNRSIGGFSNLLEVCSELG